jgi:two-component system chemotaxis response regulator CheB
MTTHRKPSAARVAPVRSGVRRIVIADGSAVVRGMVAKWLTDRPEFALVGYAVDAEQAERVLSQKRPDLLVIDLDMASLTSAGDLARLLGTVPGLRVVALSGAASSNAGWSDLAGVVASVKKPAAEHLGGCDRFRDALLAAVSLGEPAPVSLPSSLSTSPRAAPGPGVLVVAASTGGPQAIAAFLGALGRGWQPPVLIVQHMPPHLTGVFAGQLTRAGGPPVHEVTERLRLQPGQAYLAPGDQHIRVVRVGSDLWVQPDNGPEENWCRPSADPLLRSVAELGIEAMAVILTGMGHDGLEGCRRLRAAGGRVVVQDEASSVVWGMPGAVAAAGLAETVAPVAALAQAVRLRFQRAYR